MNSKILLRTLSGVLAVAMISALAGCSSAAASSEETSERAETAEAAETESTSETAADPYAYLADFSLSDPFDDKGYLTGITASDYVALPADFDKLTLSAESTVVTDEAVAEYIDSNILSNYSTTEQVTDRAAASGDNVNIDYSGSIDGVVFDGGTSAGYDITLGSGTFIPGFEDQIVGHTPGETFDVNVTFPGDYGSADLAGKDAVFVTTLNYINEDATPELNDTWVKENLTDMGVDTVAALNSYVRETLLFDQEANDIFGQLLDEATISENIPPELTKHLQDSQLATAYQYSSMYGTDLETFLTSYGYDNVDAYLTSVTTSVTNMSNQFLLMQCIAEKYDIVCDTATLDSNFDTFFPGGDKESYISRYGENYLKMNTLHNMVMQKLIDGATKA